jgi:RNA polymerase sigma-70 factor (ECF subfamily)
MPNGLAEDQSLLVDRYVDAFERYDVPALTALLHEEATLSMPPYSLWLQGHDAISAFLLGRGAGCRGSQLVPTSACGAPAFGQYKPGADGSFTPWALIVLEVDGGKIAAMNFFLDTAHLFPRFGLPHELKE